MGLFERNNGKMLFILKRIGYLKWRIIEKLIDGYYYDDMNAEFIIEFDSSKVRIFNKFFH